MKGIISTIAIIALAFFGYTYFSSAKLPQECLDYKTTYYESVGFLESKNSDGSLSPTINMLKQVGSQLDEAIDPNKRYKRNKIEELRTMCIQTKTLTEEALNQFKRLM